jgi:ribonuclease HI
MEVVRVNPSIVTWTVNMLTNRRIISTLGKSTVTKKATRGTPQGGVLSPLLWVLVVNTILKDLKNSGIKTVAYADDVVILARGKFPDTLSEITEGALRKLLKWAHRWGLGVNPAKTKLVLFTRKYKIPSFGKPRLGGTELKLSDEAKYLGVILDKKLNWNTHIEERRKKAYNALYICRRFAGSSWGLAPRISHWLYTSVVRPILTYGCLVWWTALSKVTARKRLTTVQRSACVGVSGALRTTPTEALECMLDLTPLDLYVKGQAAKSAVRLSASGQFNEAREGHATILKTGWGQLKLRENDYLTPIYCFNRRFELYIPERDEWQDRDIGVDDDIKVYTDGSKMECGTGSGIYSGSLGFNESIRLMNSCTVFQAEVVGILTAIKLIKDSNITGKNLCIYTDSQAAIKALGNNTIKSKTIAECFNALNDACNRNNIRICWIPGHENHEGNEKADELARNGSALEINRALRTIGIPLCSIKQRINQVIEEEHNSRWKNLSTCAASKIFWPAVNKGRSRKLLVNNRNTLRKLIAIFTGHNLLRKHAKKMNLIESDECRYCEGLDSTESILHILTECEAIGRTRCKYLGDYNSLQAIHGLEGAQLLKFLNRINCCPLTVG